MGLIIENFDRPTKKYYFSRRSSILNVCIKKAKPGGYLDFLLGNFELDEVEDQFWPTRQKEETILPTKCG